MSFFFYSTFFFLASFVFLLSFTDSFFSSSCYFHINVEPISVSIPMSEEVPIRPTIDMAAIFARAMFLRKRRFL